MRKVPPGRFARLALKVNAFLLIAFALAGAFIAMVAYKQGWFEHQSPIHFVTPNALGLNKGMPVKLHGFTIGSVPVPSQIGSRGFMWRIEVSGLPTPSAPGPVYGSEISRPWCETGSLRSNTLRMIAT